MAMNFGPLAERSGVIGTRGAESGASTAVPAKDIIVSPRDQYHPAMATRINDQGFVHAALHRRAVNLALARMAMKTAKQDIAT